MSTVTVPTEDASPPPKAERPQPISSQAFVATAWLGPQVGVIALIVLVGFGYDKEMSTLLGAAAWVASWLLSGLVYGQFNSPKDANSRSFGELMSKLTTLEDRRDALCGSNVSSACKEASDHLTWVKKHTSGVGALPWVTGAGYISIWQRLHRAEEALIGALPPDQLPDEVLHDELRLKDSTIPNRDDLTNILRAVKQYLRDRKDDTSADPFIQSDEGAASALKEVRFSVDDFRDTSRNGLLQLRNQTMATLLLTNIVLFAFAAVAVGGGASRSAMLAATVFYLVGAGIGLFNRLNQQFQAQAGVEDYGLTTARLVAVPVYSGLAAVAGVLITAVAGTATATAPRVPDLVTVFGIPPVTGLLVVAAAFGATPALVLSRLSDAAEKFKSGITSTEPGNRG